MPDPLQRLRLGMYLLGTVVLLSVAGFHFIAGYPWLEAVWMVVITLATVGFAERSDEPPAVQILTIAVILGGVSAFAWFSSSLIQTLLDGDFRKALGARKLNKQLSALQQHVLICGYGRLGQDLAEQLAVRQIPCVAIDREDRSAAISGEEGLLLLQGDATQEEILVRAGIGRARSIVCALPGDADNVFVALTARNLAPGIQIVARAEQPSSCKKLRQAGANKIVMPHHSGAQQMERMISRPTSADLLELLSGSRQDRVELDEFLISGDCPLSGKTLAGCRAEHYFGLLVVGIRLASGELLFHPPAESRLQTGDCLIVMGSLAEIDRFRQHYRL